MFYNPGLYQSVAQNVSQSRQVMPSTHSLHSTAAKVFDFAPIIAWGKSTSRTHFKYGLNFVQRRSFVIHQVAPITFQKMLLGIDKGLSGKPDRF